MHSLATFATRAPGVFAAGDVTAAMPSVANAVASGHRAAAMLVGSLIADGHAVAPAGAAGAGGAGRNP
jgi:pyruvate/2-oxoglutarate dehydrogenase complex dihydrolipoamide dehydrogenase (E3) component